MKKLDYADIDRQQQLVDVRTQHDYQAGYIPRSLNLNPKNFKKYARDFLETDSPLVFIIGEESEAEIAELEEVGADSGFTQMEGYLSIDEVPKESLSQMNPISAKDFLKQVDDYILLDIRHPDEITRPAPEKNLVNIPLEELPKQVGKLDGRKQVYTLCGSGNRSTSAASYLTERGFKATVVAGGMKAIQEEQNK